MTYGSIAEAAGNPQGSRQVARLLSSSSKKYHLPWHRVVNSKGKISLKPEQGKELQEALLANEGVGIQDGIIDLSIYARGACTVDPS